MLKFARRRLAVTNRGSLALSVQHPVKITPSSGNNVQRRHFLATKGAVNGRRALATVFGAVLTLTVFPAPAHAVTSVTSGATKCSVTAKAPTLSATKQLVGSISVVCTATALVTIELTVVELDGTVEDKTTLLVNKTVTQTLTKNVAVTLNTNAATCISTEVGNEEYATKGRVSLSGLVSPFDRTVPKADAFAC